MTTLLHCPFCGQLKLSFRYLGSSRYAVYCTDEKCQAVGPARGMENAADAWNERAEDEPLLEEGWVDLSAEALAMVQLLMTAPQPSDFDRMDTDLFFTAHKSWLEKVKALIHRLNNQDAKP